MEMTKDVLKKQCKNDGLYSTAHLNDKIYLHYKGFRRVENLDEYTGLKCIWLEGNGLYKIEGLEKLVNLKTVYLHENLIGKMEGLETLVELDTLNLSKNYISCVSGLDTCKKLTNLNLSSCALKTAEDIEHVLQVPSLQTLDIQHNKIDDPRVVEILEQLPDLRVVYLQGNPVVKKIPHYRKTLIFKLKNLKYLDDRPVFDEEKRRTIAWYTAFLEGGVSAAQVAERAELDAIRDEKAAIDERNFRAMEEMMRTGLEIRKKNEAAAAAAAAAEAEKTGLPIPPSGAPVNVFTGEKILDVPESESVKNAREARLASIMSSGGQGGADADAPPPLPPVEDSDAQQVSAGTGAADMPPVPPCAHLDAAREKEERDAAMRELKLAAIADEEGAVDDQKVSPTPKASSVDLCELD